MSDFVDQFAKDPVGTIYEWQDYRPADIRHILSVLQHAGVAIRVPGRKWQKINAVPRTFGL